MTNERPTVRPVTLSRLVELTHVCEDEAQSTEDIENTLGVSHRRARETILEANRIDLLQESETDNDLIYATTYVGESFLEAVRAEDWKKVSGVLSTQSPHYRTFLEMLEEVDPIDLDTLLEHLEERQEYTPYAFNQTSVEIIGDWAERLGRVQRNAFTGSYYLTTEAEVPRNFHSILLRAYDDLEQTAGVNLRQRYLSIPRLREEVCEQIRCRRSEFDELLLKLCQQNIGKVELSGAPMDTAAKDAALGIKQIDLADDGGLVSTSQSTQQVMSGVEQYDKQYYYLAVYDRDIAFKPEDSK